MSNSNEAKLVAPCGINCGGCIAYFGYTMNGKKRKHSCNGCWSRPRPCAFIKKKCEKLAKGKLRYCFECSDFPCEVLSILDTRYREKYGFSLVENLRYIQEYGVKEFLKLEKQRWKCPVCGKMICVHDKKCYSCKTS